MSKYGLYDPRSLRQNDDHMVINFVNALDVSDIEEVAIRSTKDADHIMSQLRAQVSSVETPLLIFGKDMVRLMGAITMLPDQPGDGMIMVKKADGGHETFSIKADFGVDEDDFPAQGVGFARGYIEDGTLHAYQIAMKAITPKPGAAPAPERMAEAG